MSSHRRSAFCPESPQHTVTFQLDNTPVLVLNSTGMIYKGQLVEDAGAAHVAWLETMTSMAQVPDYTTSHLHIATVLNRVASVLSLAVPPTLRATEDSRLMVLVTHGGYDHELPFDPNMTVINYVTWAVEKIADFSYVVYKTL